MSLDLKLMRDLELIQLASGRVDNQLLPASLRNMSATVFFGRLISTIVSGIIMIGGIVFFIMLLIGGIQWISAGGDKGKLQEAQERITQAGIGLLVLFSSWAVIKLIEAVTTVQILNIDIGALIIPAG